MSAIPATDPLHPALGLPSAPPVRDASGSGGPPSGMPRSFAAVFQSVEESAEGRQIEEEGLPESGTALSAEGVASAHTREAPLRAFGLAKLATGSPPVAGATGAAPVSSEAAQDRTPPLADISEQASMLLGDETLAVPIKGPTPVQDRPNIGPGVPPNAAGTHPEVVKTLELHPATPRLVELAGSTTPGQPQVNAPEVTLGALNRLDQDPRRELGATTPQGMRLHGVPGSPSLSGFGGQHEFDPEDALQAGPNSLSLRNAGSGPGQSGPAQTGVGYAPAPPLAARSTVPAGFGLRDALAPTRFSAETIGIDPVNDGRTQDLVELSEWRVAIPTGPSGPVQPLASLARTDLPQAVAQQIAAAVQARDAGKSTIDLRLAPEELGRVRLSLTSHEGVVTVTVVAERPETLDLMRRHVDALARGLLDAGYQEARFSFAGQDSGGSAAKPPKAQGAAPRQEQGFSLSPDPSGTLALRTPAMAGGRINVLI